MSRNSPAVIQWKCWTVSRSISGRTAVPPPTARIDSSANTQTRLINLTIARSPLSGGHTLHVDGAGTAVDGSRAPLSRHHLHGDDTTKPRSARSPPAPDRAGHAGSLPRATTPG